MLSESYFFPPVTFVLSFMKIEMRVACFPLGSGLYVGHDSSHRKKTPFGVYVFGSCIIILYQIQALGGRSLPHHRWCSDPILNCSEMGRHHFQVV